MPRYFFDIRKTSGDPFELQDEEGNHCGDDRMAEREAIGILGEMTRSMASGDDEGSSIQADYSGGTLWPFARPALTGTSAGLADASSKVSSVSSGLGPT